MRLLRVGAPVVVVGGAKSAIDIAVDAISVGGAASSTLLYRSAHWGTPRLIAGLIPFQYVFLSRFGQLLVRYSRRQSTWFLVRHASLHDSLHLSLPPA